MRVPETLQSTSEPAAPVVPELKSGVNALDMALPSDPLSGAEVGSCEILSCLMPGNSKTLVGFRLKPAEGSNVVLLRRLDGGVSPEIAANARVAATLNHPQLERIFGIEESDEGSFWVSELVPGATLSEIQIACKRAQSTFPVGFALGAANDALKGLAHIHASTESFSAPRKHAYGLIRPQNIVVNFTGRATLLNPQFLTWPSAYSVESEPLLGNSGYLAPEAIRGERLDPRSDVFSLAVLIHELLTGRQAFRGRNAKERANATLKLDVPPPSRLNLSLNPLLDAVILKALSASPADRYSNATEFANAFQQTAGEYMWRESQRAQWMEKIFPERSRRVRTLLTTMLKEREASLVAREAEKTRAETARADKLAADKARQEEQRLAAAALAAASVVAQTSAARGTVPGSSRKPLLLGLAAVVLVGVITAAIFLRRSPPVVAVPAAPPPTVVAAPASIPPAPEPAAAAPAVAAPDPAPAGTAAATGEVAKPKKKKRQEAPLPPWLR